MELQRGKHGRFYRCIRFPDCRGSHKANHNGKPLGRPADAATRQARIRAHAMFDRLWKEGGLTREQAYIWMQRELRLPKSSAHIGLFTIEDCKRLLTALKKAKKQGMMKK